MSSINFSFASRLAADAALREATIRAPIEMFKNGTPEILQKFLAEKSKEASAAGQVFTVVDMSFGHKGCNDDTLALIVKLFGQTMECIKLPPGEGCLITDNGFELLKNAQKLTSIIFLEWSKSSVTKEVVEALQKLKNNLVVCE